MTDWIPTADDPAQCEITNLCARIAELEAENKRLRAEHDLYISGTVNWDSGEMTWTTTPPPFVHSPGYEANEMDARDLPY